MEKFMLVIIPYLILIVLWSYLYNKRKIPEIHEKPWTTLFNGITSVTIILTFVGANYGWFEFGFLSDKDRTIDISFSPLEIVANSKNINFEITIVNKGSLPIHNVTLARILIHDPTRGWVESQVIFGKYKRAVSTYPRLEPGESYTFKIEPLPEIELQYSGREYPIIVQICSREICISKEFELKII